MNPSSIHGVSDVSEVAAATVRPLASRFALSMTPADATPDGSYDMRADDTGTWRRDTEDRDT